MHRFRLFFVLITVSLVLAACPPIAPDIGPVPGYEVWISDQTNDLVLVYEGGTWELIAEIDLKAPDQERGVSKPHMIVFGPDERYAYVANVGSPEDTNNVVVIDVASYEPVAVLPAGPSAHAAIPSNDGSRIWVANIAAHNFTEILFHAETETWEVSRTIPSYGTRPICQWFTADDSAVYVTNGGTPDVVGNLTIIDVESGELIREVENLGREACGTWLARDGVRMYANTGYHEANEPELNDRVLVFDTRDHSLIVETQLQGQDGHGLAESPDGSELWIVGRHSRTVEIFDAETLELLDKIEDVGDRPDLAAFSPDGRYFFTSQRGEAVTGVVHAVSGETPGFTVTDVATQELVTIVPAEGDVHGLAVRRVEHATPFESYWP